METALLKVRSDVLRAIDNEEITCMTLLDLSAVFHKVDRNVLLNCLEKLFGICKVSLAGVNSYLSGRTKKEAVSDLSTDLGATSDPVTLTFGVHKVSPWSHFLYSVHHPTGTNLQETWDNLSDAHG